MVFFASLDIVLTRVILFFSGVEINPVASMVIETFGVPGMSVFKFAVVSFVIIVCEIVGRTRVVTAKRLAVFAVVITGFPVVWSSVLVGSIIVDGELPPLEDDPSRDRRQVVEYAPGSELTIELIDGQIKSKQGRVLEWTVDTAVRESSSLGVALAAPISPRN
ncbi:MAG: hypothetical protein HOL13_10600 [Phycisphaerae bacterium]|nr:hypothetical protein [Phycisphaerae bacterium]